MSWKPHTHPKAVALRLVSILWGAGWFYWACDRAKAFAAEHPNDPGVLGVAIMSALLAIAAWLVVGPWCTYHARRIQRLYNPRMVV